MPTSSPLANMKNVSAKSRLRDAARPEAVHPQRDRSKLAEWLSLAISVAVLISDIAALAIFISSPTLGINALAGLIVVTAMCVPAGIVVYDAIRSRTQATCRLADADKMNEVLETKAATLGRSDVIRHLADSCSENAVLHVIGPSGVGKTSLVRAALVQETGAPQARKGSRRLYPVVVDGLGSCQFDAVESLVVAAWHKAHRDFPEQSLPTSIPDRVDHLIELFEKYRLLPVLIFDRVDDYAANCGESHGARRDVAGGALSDGAGVWSRLFVQAERQRLRIVLIAQDPSHPWRLSKHRAEVISIARSTTAAVRDLLESIGSACVHPNGTVWRELSSRLIADLRSPVDGDILPIQASLAIRGLSTLDRLDSDTYAAQGGLSGLITRPIRHCIAEAAGGGLQFDHVVELLCSLAERDGTTLTPRPATWLAEVWKGIAPTVPFSVVEQALCQISTHHIIQVSHAQSGDVWSICHSFIAESLYIIRTSRQPPSIALERAATAFRSARGLRKCGALLWPPAILRFIRCAYKGVCDLRPHRTFMILSALQCVVLGSAGVYWVYLSCAASSALYASMQEPLFDEVKWRVQLEDEGVVRRIADDLRNSRHVAGLIRGYSLKDPSPTVQYEIDMYFDTPDNRVRDSGYLVYYRAKATSLASPAVFRGRWIVSALDTAGDSISAAWRRSEPVEPESRFSIDDVGQDVLDAFEMQALSASKTSRLFASIPRRIKAPMNVAVAELRRSMVLPSIRSEWRFEPSDQSSSRMVIFQVTEVAATEPRDRGRFLPTKVPSNIESLFQEPLMKRWFEVEAEEQGVTRFERAVWMTERLEVRNAISATWGLDSFVPTVLPKYGYAHSWRTPGVR